MDANKNQIKMENGENKDLQGRREFFKEAARKALPLFAVALLGTSVFSSCSKENIGCGNSCSGSCSKSCSGDCDGGCSGDCDNSCHDACMYGCTFYQR